MDVFFIYFIHKETKQHIFIAENEKPTPLTCQKKNKLRGKGSFPSAWINLWVIHGSSCDHSNQTHDPSIEKKRGLQPITELINMSWVACESRKIFPAASMLSKRTEERTIVIGNERTHKSSSWTSEVYQSSKKSIKPQQRPQKSKKLYHRL